MKRLESHKILQNAMFCSEDLMIYFACNIQAGAEIEGPKLQTFNGQEVEVWPRVVWSPKWALTFSDVKKKIKGCCRISQPSSLVLDGENIILENLDLGGALIIRATTGSQVRASWPK
jgi:UDP-sugar pyrophosphorylase